MPNYIVKARNTSVITEVPVTADTREAAIDMIVKTAKPGEQMEVMDVAEVPADEAAPKHEKKEHEHEKKEKEKDKGK